VYDSIQQGEIKAEIAFVFCSREPGEAKESDLFIRLVNRYHLPLFCYSYQKFKAERGTASSDQITLPEWRLDYDRQVMKKLCGFTPDLCVLAGYMLIVGKEMCQKYNMINLHPAAPGGPTGTWQEVIWQLIDNKARTTGVMMHLVTPELDKGPPVSYCTFFIRGKPFNTLWQKIEELPVSSTEWHEARKSLFNLIRKHELTREFPLIISTVKAFSQGKIRITQGKKIIDSKFESITGYNLTSEIDEKVSRLLTRTKG
jgi:folate-dependent phosphoribosylglycinamide formyltransferase PurN